MRKPSVTLCGINEIRRSATQVSHKYPPLENNINLPLKPQQTWFRNCVAVQWRLTFQSTFFFEVLL